jgi:hypothetical protein
MYIGMSEVCVNVHWNVGGLCNCTLECGGLCNEASQIIIDLLQHQTSN